MSKSALPQGIELGVLLRSAGMIDANPTDTQQLHDFDAACNSAATRFGRVTGYTPFLANATDVLRKFDPPGPTIDGTRYGWRTRGGQRILRLDNGLVSLTSVTTNVDPQNAGTVRVLGTDFFLRPTNAVAEGRPWQEIEFTVPVWGIQESIHILGKWGYGATVPDDAWDAMIYMAAGRIVPQISADLHSGMSQIKLGNDSFSFPTGGPFATTLALWKSHICDAINEYLRDI